jgi:hypothetical protein
MTVRNLLFVSLAVFGVVALPATAAHALLVKVSINFGPTVARPDDGTLVVTAELSRDVGSALELTGQGFDGAPTRTPPTLGSSSISCPQTGLHRLRRERW